MPLNTATQFFPSIFEQPSKVHSQSVAKGPHIVMWNVKPILMLFNVKCGVQHHYVVRWIFQPTFPEIFSSFPSSLQCGVKNILCHFGHTIHNSTPSEVQNIIQCPQVNVTRNVSIHCTMKTTDTVLLTKQLNSCIYTINILIVISCCKQIYFHYKIPSILIE